MCSVKVAKIKNFKKMKGFTLIELLVVIGIVVILMAAALIAINPFRQFAMANNANRWSGVTTIMNAIYQNVVDNRGVFTCAVGDIPVAATIMGSGTGQYNICGCLVPTYLGSMPVDPQPPGAYTDCTTYNTGYNICNGCVTTGRITVCAPNTQIPPETTTICITR